MNLRTMQSILSAFLGEREYEVAYIFLALAGLLPTLWLLRRRYTPPLSATLLLGGSLTILADWVAHGWFNWYVYQPRLLRNPTADAMLGEFLGDTLFVPCAAAVLLTYLSPWQTALVGTPLVTGLELIFLRTGLLVDNRWGPWMTLASFPIFFLLVGLFRRGADLQGLTRGWIQALTRLAMAILFNGLLRQVLKSLDLIHFPLRLLPDPGGNQSLGLFCLLVLGAAPLTYGVIVTGRVLTAAFAWAGLVTLLQAAGWLTMNWPWGPLWLGVIQAGIGYAACHLDRLLTREGQPPTTR